MSVKEINEFLKNNKIDIPFEVILVTGTNGKTSTSHLINLFLLRFFKILGIDLKVGLFSKPHILKINERIKINYIDIDDNSLNYFSKKVNELKGSINLNWFDELVLVTILYFLKNNIDVSIFEIGIGGRYDSTNALNSIINVITNIGLEHIDILGNSIKSIAYQKSGIIKDNSFTLTYANKGFKTIYNQALKKNSFILNLNHLFKIKLIDISLNDNYEFNKNNYQFNFKFVYFIKLLNNVKLINNLNAKIFKDFKNSKKIFFSLYKVLRISFKDILIIEFYNPYLIKNYLIAFVSSLLFLILNGYEGLVIKNLDEIKSVFINLSREFDLAGRFNIFKINNSFVLIDSAKDVVALEYILKLFFNKLYKMISNSLLNDLEISIVLSFSKGKDFSRFKNIYNILYRNSDKIKNIYFLEHLVEAKSEKSDIIFEEFYKNLVKISNNDYKILSKLKNLSKLDENKIIEILKENKFIFITGSIYFVANIIDIIKEKIFI
ncbi:MAG: Mur ligase family protein [bacterium]